MGEAPYYFLEQFKKELVDGPSGGKKEDKLGMRASRYDYWG